MKKIVFYSYYKLLEVWITWLHREYGSAYQKSHKFLLLGPKYQAFWLVELVTRKETKLISLVLVVWSVGRLVMLISSTY